MKRILVTGASGQIGSELIPALREKYGGENVIAARHRKPLTKEVEDGGPSITLDVTSQADVEKAVKTHKPGHIYHLSSILSASAEKNRQAAYEVNFNGLFYILEAAVANKVSRVVVPSSIAAFGPETPRNAPNDTLQKPTGLYGISKVFGELMGNYYYRAAKLDVRGVRLPGIISWKVEPTAGTTDYAVAIFYGAILEGRYTCYLKPDTALPMMYMPDAIDSLIGVAEADLGGSAHRADYNVNAVSFTPAQLAKAIVKRMPAFKMDYEIDPLRQAIADSWPDALDDSLARKDWGWRHRFGIETMVDDMFANLTKKLKG
ncbi:MAG: NAD-dependent epimerase/dehydratase family protein [SAR202 cluster bacterium]|nr:NAD-dependent epimerase/dehydratase family protein [SAR202 cluster bacterium]